MPFALRARAGARVPVMTAALIAAILLAYLVSIAGGGSLASGPSHATIVAYGAIPYELTHPASHCELAAAGFSQSVLCSGQAGVRGTPAPQPPTWLSVLTSLLLHANLWTLALDVALLALAGARLERALGPLRTLGIYLLGGLGALALTVAALPQASTAVLASTGASGAVLGALLALLPRERALVASLPALAWAGLHTLGAGGGAAEGWQLGGLALGLLAARLLSLRRGADGVGDLRAAGGAGLPDDDRLVV